MESFCLRVRFSPSDLASAEVTRELQGNERQFPRESRTASSSVKYFAPRLHSIQEAVVLPVFAKLGISIPSSPSFMAAPCAIYISDLRSEEHTSELQSPVHLVCRL